MVFVFFVFLCFPFLSFSNDKELDDDNPHDEIVLADFHDKTDKMEGRAYTLKFKGFVPEDVLEDFKKVSLLIKLSNRIPSSITGLGKRADNDKKLFKKVLLSHGYLGAKVDFRISSKKDRDVVKFKIDLADRYKISNITLEASDNPSLFLDYPKELSQDILNIAPNDDVNFSKLLEATKFLKRYLQEHGYPHIQIEKPIGNVEHKAKTMDVTLKMHTGIFAYIKETHIIDLKSVDEDFIRNRLLWKKGEVYNVNKIEKTKGILSETELVSNMETEISPLDMRDCILDHDNHPIPQPIILTTKIKEMPPRAIGVDLSYSIVEKVGGRFYWHHNNIFGHQEHFGFLLKYSPLLKKAKISFDLYDCFNPLQTVSFQSYIQKESDVLSYSGNTQSASVNVSRPIMDNIHLKGHIGFVYEQAHLNQTNFLNSNNSFHDKHNILGIPLSVSFDTSNNKLNPAEGMRTQLTVTPYTGKMQSIKSFTLLKADCSYYLPLLKTQLGEPVFVIASFIRYGKLLMAKSAIPPLNKRFFLGGAGSVRAYGHKKLSPFATNQSSNNVIFIGGRSMFECGTELRYRINEDWGVVSFFEGGMVDHAVANVDTVKKKLFLCGAGCGVRYFTTFAPVRVDIAFPFVKRYDPVSKTKVDSSFQIYISIGQSF